MKNIEILKLYNLKVTPQRLQILELLKEYGHLSIDDLYQKVKNKFSILSLSTIYKNLNKMYESGLILKVKIPHEKDVYEIVKEKHLHLFCKKCGSLEDIKLPVETIEEEVKESYGFKSEDIDIVFYGLCKDCSK